MIRPFGALLLYAHGMGTVMRCPGCDAVVLRIARTRTQLWFDLTGAKLVVAASAAAPSRVQSGCRLPLLAYSLCRIGSNPPPQSKRKEG